jgi:nucleoside-diphosphate-sugar epimerase
VSKRVAVVTGGAGAIGSARGDALRAHGLRVAVVDPTVATRSGVFGPAPDRRAAQLRSVAADSVGSRAGIGRTAGLALA